MALIVFLGIWAKLTYLWLLPSIGILLLILLLENKTSLNRIACKKIVLHILGSGFLLILSLGCIFLSTDPHNSNRFPYLEQITNSKSLSIHQLFQLNIIRNRGVVKALFNPFEATQRIFVVKEPNLITAFYCGVIFLFVPTCLLALRINWRDKIKPSLFYFASLLTFTITLYTERAWAMHHTVLSFPFFLLSILAVIDLFRKHYAKKFARIAMISAIIFVFLNSYFFINFPKQRIKEHDDWSKIEIHKQLQNPELANDYFYVVVDWGMYYYQGLYGPSFQSVLYMEPLNSQSQIDILKQMSREHNRKLLFIYRHDRSSSNLDLIRKSFRLEENKTTSKDQIWHIMQEA